MRAWLRLSPLLRRCSHAKGSPFRGALACHIGGRGTDEWGTITDLQAGDGAHDLAQSFADWWWTPCAVARPDAGTTLFGASCLGPPARRSLR
eukprot:5981211-Ditylum_brightwellii.AAC.1